MIVECMNSAAFVMKHHQRDIQIGTVTYLYTLVTFP